MQDHYYHHFYLNKISAKYYSKIFLFIGKNDDKERSKHDKKAEEKAAKQEKKREKEANKNKKIIPDHSSTTLTNHSLNTSSAGISRKLYDDELEPSEELMNDNEQLSGIQMMTFRSSEIKGKLALVHFFIP